MNPNNSNQYLAGTIQIPSSLLISDITRAYPMVVTCTVNSVTASNTYVVGQLVRLMVPRSYGMSQANNLVAQIISVNGLEFGLNVDSTNFDQFVIPVSTAEGPASLAPAGSRNLEYSNATNKVAFQSLNNVGN